MASLLDMPEVIRKVILDYGVCKHNKEIYLFHTISNNQQFIKVAKSKNGFLFVSTKNTPQIIDKNKYILTAKSTVYQKGYIFSSRNGIMWTENNLLPINETSQIIAKPYKQKGYNLFFGDKEISIMQTNDFKNWENRKIILTPRDNHFDRYPLQLFSVMPTQSGTVIFYLVIIKKREGNHFLIGAALVENGNPSNVLWRSSHAIWEQPNEWDTKTIVPLGAAEIDEKLLFYFATNEPNVYAISDDSFSELLHIKKLLHTPKLNKIAKNPIITPVVQHWWENTATFNTAAINENNKIHFLYRAIGHDNTSMLGYASSTDGENIDERLHNPAYTPREPFELPNGKPVIAYMSGGGYGGIEDPRLTKIGNTIYLTYVAFDGCNPPRVALSSIDVENFVNKRFTWSKPKLISKPGVVDKNAVIFPEKIHGKYVIMHRIFPNILVDFVDDLLFENTYLKGEYKISPRQDYWDSRKIGAGAPPIKTDKGWLLIYHAVDDRDASQYKIGAMLLDLENPLKILYWSRKPIIIPDMWYDNVGHKSGVVYPCGAVIKNNNLIVYYGGADTVVCAAKQNINEFLDLLVASSKVWPDKTIYPVPLRKV